MKRTFMLLVLAIEGDRDVITPVNRSRVLSAYLLEMRAERSLLCGRA